MVDLNREVSVLLKLDEASIKETELHLYRAMASFHHGVAKNFRDTGIAFAEKAGKLQMEINRLKKEAEEEKT